MLNLKVSLKRVIGRIDKMRLLRDILLVLFTLVFTQVLPFVNELLDPSKQAGLIKILIDNPLIAAVLMIPFICLFVLIVYIHQIDTFENSDVAKRHTELLKKIDSFQQAITNGVTEAITPLIDEIRKDRNERNNSNK